MAVPVMAEPEARSPHLRWAAAFIWLVTLFNIVIAFARTDVSKAQLVMLVALAFSSGLFAGWTLLRRGSANEGTVSRESRPLQATRSVPSDRASAVADPEGGAG